MTNNNNEIRPGFAGILGKIFINSRLTPLIAIGSILLGLIAVWLTPKEEEPQISVPMFDIMISAAGYEAEEVERKITEPVERAVWGLEGVEYIYSASSPHSSLVTVRFKVGEPVEPSLVKVHHKMMQIKKHLPPTASEPDISSFSIDDVPFLTLTFSSAERDDYSLRTRVAPLARKLSSTPDLSRIELLGGRKKAIRVSVNPERLSANGLTLAEASSAVRQNDVLLPSGKKRGGSVFDIETGGRFKTADDVRNTPVGQRGGRVVQLKDIAHVSEGPEERTRVSVLMDKSKGSSPQNAVSIVFAKRKGTNVVNLSEEILHHARTFSKSLPDDVSMTVVRDYGETASEKSTELIEHLLIATFSVALLIAIFMGLRASLVVSIAIPVTLALTLAIYYFMGYTLNRVTLFALIFSIGILVDDAIVVVENIERHLKRRNSESILKTTLKAVAEVGNPTILATFTVIAAILPMAFVTGMMGPYMKPIPVGASLAMILSLFIAFILIPFLAVRLLKKSHSEEKAQEEPSAPKRIDRLYLNIINRLLSGKKPAAIFGVSALVLLFLSTGLLFTKTVKVKMLPFDDKNEFQVLLDFPVDTPLSKSLELSKGLSESLLKHPEVKKVQIFAGEPAPYSFSGMVKHTFLRHSDYMADLQVVLSGKGERSEVSHEIIESLRPVISSFADRYGVTSRILEIPPGPPVMATMVAEIYGPDRNAIAEASENVYAAFKNEPSVVDLDYSWRQMRSRLYYGFNYPAGGLAGVRAFDTAAAGNLLFSETPLTSLSSVTAPEDVSVDFGVQDSFRTSNAPFRFQNMSSFETGITPLSGVLNKPVVRETAALHRKNLKPVSYVTSELSGPEESPVYGVMKIAPKIDYPQSTAHAPWNTDTPSVKWDGEWFITYEVFRDLGAAFAVVLVLIYVLVVGWFKSYRIPLIIMAPIPISLIGIIPGHALAGTYFTATSMIGFIAGAGIIVRNSIILVDFIEHQLSKGMEFKEAVISAGLLRFRPMLLTAASVVAGSFIMLFDPIFQGLAISLMSGEIAATLLSRFAVPVLYYWGSGRAVNRAMP